ncbi:hypothetical protein FRC02_011735, partial [Tulasnella sp. 418]
MDESHSLHTARTRVIEPQNIPLPDSILDDKADEKKDAEKLEKSKEPKELQHRNVDDDNRFWQTYVSESGKFDKELIESWNDNLDSLLLFAALFSAINTAFIVESYKRLLPDGVDSTNSLLRLMLQHRNDNETISLEDDHWSPTSQAVRVNAELFASLACSLLASFGAILGKEMLAEYKSSGALNTLPEQGRKRQRKHDGLKRYRFRLLMQILPMLLQFSLALFLIGVIDFLSQMSIAVATVIIIPVGMGLILYVISVIVAIQQEDSPFQTSLSKSLRLLFPTLKYFLRSSVRQARSFRTYITTQGPNLWDRTRKRLQPGVTIIQKSSLWVAVSTRVSQIMDDTHVVRTLRQNLSGTLVTLHIGGLGVIGWFMNWWDEVDTGLRTTLYVGGLGVAGWFMDGGETLLSAFGFGEGRGDEDLRHAAARDLVSSDCAVWLLENSQDAEVLRNTLETLPLLPADIILKRFKAQPKILERYVLMYKSAMQRRPGDVDFRLDSAVIRDAIISGTALFHVLKLRQETEQKSSQVIGFDPDPELLDAIWDDQRFMMLDFPLVTVLHCVQTQTGEGGMTYTDFSLLRRLLERFLDMIRSQSAVAEVTDGSVPPQQGSRSPFAPTIPPITLLLDAGIYMVAQKNRQWPDYGLLTECSYPIECIFMAIHSILDVHPLSMTLISHVALLLAATQWFKKKEERVFGPDGSRLEEEHVEDFEFDGIKLAQLRKAWLAVDKRADFLDNVILAMDLVGSYDSPATIEVYSDLLRFTETFFPKVMNVSNKHREWSKWWSKIVHIIPGLLRLIRQVDLKEHPETGYIAIRTIARLLPDDWAPSRVKEELSKAQYAKLQVISPVHPEHGRDITVLIGSVLSTFSTTPPSPQTRRSVAEVLGWMVMYPGVIGELPSLVDNPDGMYHQSTSVPSFLASMFDSETPSEVAGLCEHHWEVLLTIPLPDTQLAAQMRDEALATALAMISTVYYKTWTGVLWGGIRTLLNKMTQRHEKFGWPSTFIDKSPWSLWEWIVVGEGDSQRKVLQMKQDVWISDFLYTFSNTWRGEAFMILWRQLTQREGFDPADA